MGSVLEKVTLYDLLGYSVPGGVLIGQILYGVINDRMIEVLRELNSYSGAILFFLLLASYSVGLILSEITRRILDRWEKGISERTLTKEELTVDCEYVENVLKKSGIKDCVIAGYGDLCKYMGYMYSDIQTAASYQRIHNYASAEVLYKNLSFALIFGSVVPFIAGRYSCLALCGFVFGGIILCFRWARFCQKKIKYTVIWFISKNK